MITKNEKKVLRMLFAELGKDNSINQIAKACNLAPNGAFKILRKFEKEGMAIAGSNPESGLCEILENKNHPWFVGVQFHPEFKSRPLRPHPLFTAFLKACIGRKKF